MKTCRRCKQSKPESEFGRNRTRPDGYSHWCLYCRNKHYHDNYKSNGSAILSRSNENKARRRDKLREKYYEYLATHPCVDCGNTNPIVLELDHVRGKKRFNVSTRMLMVVPTWQSLLEEIAKCDVRCANCHRIKTARELGWFSHSVALATNAVE